MRQVAARISNPGTGPAPSAMLTTLPAVMNVSDVAKENLMNLTGEAVVTVTTVEVVTVTAIVTAVMTATVTVMDQVEVVVVIVTMTVIVTTTAIAEMTVIVIGIVAEIVGPGAKVALKVVIAVAVANLVANGAAIGAKVVLKAVAEAVIAGVAVIKIKKIYLRMVTRRKKTETGLAMTRITTMMNAMNRFRSEINNRPVCFQAQAKYFFMQVASILLGNPHLRYFCHSAIWLYLSRIRNLIQGGSSNPIKVLSDDLESGSFVRIDNFASLVLQYYTNPAVIG